MSDALRVRLERVLAEGGGFLFLSPHLDDAVLSCGALISTLARRAPVTVATIFSEAGPSPHTRAARAFLRQCGATGAERLYEERRREDVDVLTALGVEPVHLGACDAMFRRRERIEALTAVGRIVPEVVHRYPTYRFDIAKGRVSRGDRTLLDGLDAEVGRLVGQVDARLVFAPIGVGRHVDHLLTRSLGERHPGRVVHYSDFPYDRWGSPDAGYLTRRRLETVSWSEAIERKPELVRGYRTQAGALFADGIVPVAPERYYVPPPA